MKKLLLTMLLAATMCFGQKVSNITFDGVGDSSFRVIFDTSSAFNAMRVRYGLTSVASGTGGTVQTNGTSPYTYQLFGMTTDLSGMAPATPYFVAVEVSSDGGVTWSSGIEATVTTKPRTQVLPYPPLAISTTFPAQTGTVLNVLADCSNLQSQINQAGADQGVGLSDTIVVPPGTVCPDSYVLPMAADAVSFSPANVITSTSTIAMSSSRFSEGQEVRLSTGPVNSNCLPGQSIFPYGLNCDKGGGIRKGGRYYAHLPDSGHIQLLSSPNGLPAAMGWINITADPTSDNVTFNPTWQTPAGFSYLGMASIPANTAFQLVTSGVLPGGLLSDTTYYTKAPCAASPNAACVTQVSLTPGGLAVNITGPGSGTHTIVDQGLGTMYIAPAPTQSGPWVVLVTGGNLPASGTAIDPSWNSQVFHLRNAVPNVATPVLSTGTLSHNWLVKGANFDTGTNNDYLTSTDPRPYCGGPSTYQDSSFIMFIQVLIQGPGYPNRFGCRNNAANMFIDGFNVGFVDYYFDGFDFWHPWYSGFAPTKVSSSQVTATLGTGHGGLFTTSTTGPATLNFTAGTASGTVLDYLAMDGTMKVVAPTGTSGNCVVTGTTCTFSTAAVPSYPVDANGRTAALKLFSVVLTSGSVTSVSASDATTTSNPSVIEGCNCIIAGNGPGPYIFSHGNLSGSGLPLHFDDGGGPFLTRGDYTITRNLFFVPQTQFVTGPFSNGLWYGNRQWIEWKGGQRILMDGNIFDGAFEQINPVGVSAAFTPRSGGYVTDVAITNNIFKNADGGVNLLSPIDSITPISKPGARQLIANNLFVLNGWTHAVTGSNTRGWMAQGGYPMENLTIDHNTLFDNVGGTPALLHWAGYPGGGVKITNNIYFYTGNAPLLQNENIANCGSLADTLASRCAFTAGPGNPSYLFDHNLIIPSWNDSSGNYTLGNFVGTDKVVAAITDPGNFIPTAGSHDANIAQVKFLPNYALDPTSPYHNMGSDGKDVGFDQVAMLAAQQGLAQTPPSPVPVLDPTPVPVVTATGPQGIQGVPGPQGPPGPLWGVTNPFIKHVAPGDSCFSSGSQVWASPLMEWNAAAAFTCTIPNVPSGDYQFTFSLQEPNQARVGMRLFTISVNGVSTLPIDLYSMAKQAATKVTQRLFLPTTGTVTITFSASIRNAVISLIDILQLN